MKKETTSCFTLSHLRVFPHLLILLFTLFLLTPGLAAKANAQTDGNRQFPLPDRLILQEQKVVPSDGTMDTYFGRAVAIDGSTAVIGAIGDNDFQGAAYLFTESNGIWSEGQKLTASDGRAGDEFGRSVVLADDILVVGAAATVDGASGQGAVYVFRKAGETWIESQKLLASDGAMTDDFGVAIALSGRTLVVGAESATVADQLYQGAAYVFVETNGIWRQTQKLTGDDSVPFDNFGSAVAARGSTILVGAPNKDVDQGDFLTGEVYVFSRSDKAWNQTQTLIAEDSGFFADFGASLALDRTTALIGAPHATANGHGAQGAAYLFAVSGGTLTQTQMITSRDGASNDAFGSAVALAGHKAVIGAPSAKVGGSSLQGKAYPFREIDGNWSQVGTIIASDGAMSDFFGFAVALDRDTALVGASPVTLPHIGAAYFYAPPADNLP